MPSLHDSLFAEAAPLLTEQFADEVTVYPEHGARVELSAIVSAVRETPRSGRFEERTDEQIDVTFERFDWDEAGLVYPQKRWELKTASDPDTRPWMFSHVVTCGVCLLTCRFTRTRLNRTGLNARE